ncbi:MAG TPA: sialidase family protein [Steroidobacter sp.]
MKGRWGWILSAMGGVLATFCLASIAAAMSAPGAGLGTSAVLDEAGRLWIAYAECDGASCNVMLRYSDDRGAGWASPIRVTTRPEPVSADGENRPKLAIGSRGELYVTWTSPTSERYTGDIRFTRSLDGGERWSPPIVVHRDRELITHRFESLAVDGAGRVWVTWVDKRDLHRAQAAGENYSGAAVYYAYSEDGGESWNGDFKLADHTCECCRIALARDPEGRIAALWRHVFPPNERDHAFALLTPKGSPTVSRATFDRWRIDACPHHGPSLAYSRDGTVHAVWFNHKAGQGRAFYGQLTDTQPTNVRKLPAGAQHADLAISGRTIAVAWKRFDGQVTKVESLVSHDRGRSFAPGPALSVSGPSDQPRVVANDDSVLIVWRHSRGIAVANVGERGSTSAEGLTAARLQRESVGEIKPFLRTTLGKIERANAGKPFWLVLWDLECTYCMKSLANLAAAQRAAPEMRVVTISTDPVTAAPELSARLAELGVRSEAYAFGNDSVEALRFAIDPSWIGEKPRAYRYSKSGEREVLSGVLSPEEWREMR